MTDAEKIAMVENIACDPTVDDTVASLYLAIAKDKILQRAYPFRSDTSSLSLPKKYDVLQCQLAVRLLHRRGIEGEKSNIDNGIHRVFEHAYDDDLLSEVMQVVG